jgi:hypothetical protein
MVAKLLKWELKATSKWFLLMYLVLIVMSLAALCMNAIIGSGAKFQNSFWQGVEGIGYILFFLSIIAVIIMTFVLVAVRFYRNMTGDEGYLMHTLPAKTWQHIISKLIVATMWNTLTIAVVTLSIFLVFARMGILSSLRTFYIAATNAGIHLTAWVIVGIILVIINVAANVLTYYAAMATGPVLIKDHRLGGSIVAYVIIYIVYQILSFVVLFISQISIYNDMLEGSTSSYGYIGGVSIDGMNEIIMAVYVSVFALSAITIASCYFLTHYMMKKKLNLP